jgi:hypothetical protein
MGEREALRAAPEGGAIIFTAGTNLPPPSSGPSRPAVPEAALPAPAFTRVKSYFSVTGVLIMQFI